MLIGEDGSVKVSDLGQSKLLENGDVYMSTTAPGASSIRSAVVGTVLNLFLFTDEDLGVLMQLLFADRASS